MYCLVGLTSMNMCKSFVCVCRWVVAQSVFYHLYNQVSYMSLDEISPLTFSIGNTMKRVTVIVSSIIIFHTAVRPINAAGAAIAILGTFLYSQVYFVLESALAMLCVVRADVCVHACMCMHLLQVVVCFLGRISLRTRFWSTFWYVYMYACVQISDIGD